MTTDDQNEDQPEPGRLRQIVDEANARAAAAEANLAQLQARELFRDAGLDPSKPLHQAVMRAYDGAPEADAVREYVTTLGVTEAPQPQVETPPTDPDEQAALIRIAEAARDSGAPAPTPDRRAQLQDQLAKLPRTATIQEIDRLTEEFSRAGGYAVKSE